MGRDLKPLAWGAQDRFQAHFIVKTPGEISEEKFLARPKIDTQGHFASKRVLKVKWMGGGLANSLNSDAELETMMKKLSVKDANISIEPTKGGVRIHGPWKGSYDFIITKEMFAVYDRIALHVKKELGLPPIKS